MKVLKKYSWVNGSRIKGVNVTAAGKEIERLTAKYKDNLKVDYLINESVPKNSPTHNAFTWDNTKAAHERRQDQGRLLLRSIKVIIVEEKREKAYPVRVTTALMDNKGKGVYGDTFRILSDPAKRKLAVKQALQEFVSMRNKYAHLEELASIFAAVDGYTSPKKGR